jgi:hypothetical protein
VTDILSILHKDSRYTRQVNIVDCIRFERCVVDELQSQGTGIKLEDILRVHALYRWCISGTPFTHDDDVVGMLQYLRHPMAEPLQLGLAVTKSMSSPPEHGLLRASLLRASNRGGEEPLRADLGQLYRVLLLQRLAVPILKPLVLRQFPRATLSPEKLRELGLRIKIAVPIPRNQEGLAYVVRQAIMTPTDLESYGSPNLRPRLSREQKVYYHENAAQLARSKKNLPVLRRMLHASSVPPPDAIVQITEKVLVLCDLVEAVLSEKPQSRIIILYDYVDMEKRLYSWLSRHGIQTIRHRDSTPDRLKKFCDGCSKEQVIIMNIRKLVDGFNAQVASHVIFTAPYLETWRMDQSISRAFRIGQDKTVHVWVLSGSTPLEDWATGRLLRHLHDDSKLASHGDGSNVADLYRRFQIKQSADGGVGLEVTDTDADLEQRLTECQVLEYREQGYCLLEQQVVPFAGGPATTGTFYGQHNGSGPLAGAFIFNRDGRMGKRFYHAFSTRDWGEGKGLIGLGVKSKWLTPAKDAERISLWLGEHLKPGEEVQTGKQDDDGDGNGGGGFEGGGSGTDSGENTRSLGKGKNKSKGPVCKEPPSQSHSTEKPSTVLASCDSGDGSISAGQGKGKSPISRKPKPKSSSPQVSGIMGETSDSGDDSSSLGKVQGKGKGPRHKKLKLKASPSLAVRGTFGGSADQDTVETSISEQGKDKGPTSKAPNDTDSEFVFEIDLDTHTNTTAVANEMANGLLRALQARYDRDYLRPDFYAVSATEAIEEEFNRWMAAGEGWETFLVVGAISGSGNAPFFVANQGVSALRAGLEADDRQRVSPTPEYATTLSRVQHKVTAYVFVAVKWEKSS